MHTSSGHRLLQNLRARAQAQLHNREMAPAMASATTDPTQHLLNELETHQLELEMQNEELLAAHHAAEQARIEAEQARSEAEQARNDYAHLFEHAPVAYVTLTAAGFIEHVNHRACHLLGTTAARLVARRFLLFVAPAFRPAAAEWLAQLSNNDALLSIELDLLNDAGTPLLVQLIGGAGPAAAQSYRLTLLDAAERDQAAAALHRSQERTRLALAASGAGVLEWDCGTDQLFLDELARTLFGLPGPAAPLPLATVQARVLPEDQPMLTAALDRAAMGESLEVEFRVLAQTGPPRYLAAYGEVVFDSATRLQFIGQVRDVTAAHQAQEEMAALRLGQQQALFEAVQATQEEERRRMAEALHNGVGQLLYILKLRLAQGPEAPAGAALHLLEEAIRDVRTLSAELAPSVLQDFGLKPALEAMAKRIPKKALRVHCNFQGLEVALPPPMPTLVYRMVQELLNNVIKHAGADEVFLHVIHEANSLVINVDDDGQGMESQNSSGEPSGIGLASIRSQVARLGGRLRISSQPNHGTAISIELPTNGVTIAPLPNHP